MPYNHAPIDPPSSVSGTTSLPLTRVKKIIHADEDISNCSNNAAFAIAIATEMFIRHMTEAAHTIVKSERRPRRNIQYKDVANAVARIDNLEFLTDVVPRTTTYKAYKEKKAKEDAGAAESGLPNGQRTLYQMARVDDTAAAKAVGREEDDDGNGDDNDDDVDDAQEEELEDDGSARNASDKESGDEGADEESHLRSPNGGGGGVKARHDFDAVRNQDRDDADVAMEE